MPKKKDNSFTKQHIVPKFYLNGFGTRENKKGKFRIGVLQKGKKHFIDCTDNVGYIKNYYDDELLEDRKQWEHYYKEVIEDPCSKTIRNIIARVTLSNFGHIKLTVNERRDLSIFIVAQFTRVPQFIDYQITNAKEKFIPDFKEQFLRRYGAMLSEDKREIINGIDLTESQLKNILLTNINDRSKMEKYCSILQNRIWVVYINKIYNLIPFITSDNPVVMVNIETKSFSRSDNGIGNENTIIFLPLNPYIGIGVYPPKYWDALQHNNCRELLCNEKDMGFIQTMAKCEMNQCYKQLFLPQTYFNKLFMEG